MSKQGSASEVLSGGGEMGARMRALDWSRTPVGPVETWPQSLRTAVSILLNSRFPMMVHWGPELTQFYNDAYTPSLGAKHPGLLGQPAQPWWAEIWDVLEPMFARVLAGEATWYEDQLFLPNRHGFIEEAYFTLSHSPIRDESGGVGGIFLAVTETTGRVVGERRLRTLNDLSTATAGQPSAEAACRAAASVLERCRHDLPFALIYLSDAKQGVLRKVASVGVDVGSPAAPETVSLPAGASPFPLGDVARDGVARTLEDVLSRAGPLSGGPWPEPPRAAGVLPLGKEGDALAAGVLVAGISPRRALDADYQTFLSLVAGQVSTAIASARRAEQEQQRVEALAELDRSKTTFFSNVSHEFRTPLTLLLRPLEDVLGDPAHTLTDVQRERLTLAQRGAQRLLKLVNTLLEFSRVEAGRARATFAPTELSKLTCQLASSFESAMSKAGLSFVLDCAPLPEPVWVDAEAWEKIVLNLVSNAFKFTFSGEVRVSLRGCGDHVELQVSDTGTGIPPAELSRIFDRFHRVEGAVSRSIEGSGIGLALVRELVQLHGGSVHVASELGRGSIFTVAVPTGHAHLPADRLSPRAASLTPAPGAAAFAAEAEGWLREATSLDPAQAPEAAPAPRGTRPGAVQDGRVLVAEDNADMRAYLTRLLEEAGYEVEAVADGRAALERTRALVPDLMLSDVMMPGLDGFALVRALKGEPRTSTVPVILLSARAGEEATLQGLANGATDYLVKPFSARELVARVDGAVKTARARADLDAFAGRIAHELRNLLAPIALIGGQLRHRYPDERTRQAGEQLERVTRRAQNLLDGMLAFSRSANVALGDEGSRAREVVEDVVGDLSGLRAQVKAELVLGDIEDVEVRLPQGLLYVVLLNLVSNALKFMARRPVRRVTLSLRAQGPDRCELEVRDTGPGIPAEVLQHIFEPFYRAPGTPVSGHGIGLATVQRIVAVCGGEVRVESVVGEGTTFRLALPRGAARGPGGSHGAGR